MKKIIFCGLLGLASVAACTKDKQTSIVGKWTLTKTKSKITVNGTLLKDTTVTSSNASSYLQFNADGTGSTTLATYVGSEPGTGAIIGATDFSYQLSGNALHVNYKNNGGGTIDETALINGNQLQINFKVNDTVQTTVFSAEVTEYFTK